VTPEHRLVLVTRGDGEGTVLVAGQLAEPFAAIDESTMMADDVDVSLLRPGDPYPGPADKDGGTYKTRAKMGGVIERRALGGGNEFANRAADYDPLSANAGALLDAWRAVLNRGITFHVNGLGHAWYTEGGTRRFLADVAGGFAWPPSREQEP
jgi:hypothetical protein